MDFQGFTLDDRLLSAIDAAGLRQSIDFLSPLLARAIGKGEDVLCQVRLTTGREAAYMVPMISWLLGGAGESRRGLVVVPSDSAIAAVERVAITLCNGLGLKAAAIGAADAGNDGKTDIAIGAPAVLAGARESGALDLSSYGFIAFDGLDELIEKGMETTLRSLAPGLLPPGDRRCVCLAEKLTTRVRNLAYDLSKAPEELLIEESAARLRRIPQETYHVAVDRKMSLLLGILAREAPGRVCVFCNLKSTAEDVAKRLERNGYASEYILGVMPKRRKDEIAASDSIRALILTDEGAEDMDPAAFPLLVNYDIPLEGERYFSRYSFLDAGDSEAKIVNLACDRYIYGIPAVEQYVGVSLSDIEAPEELYAQENRSAASPRPERSDRKPDSKDGYQARRGQGQPQGRRDPKQGQPRDQGRQDRSRRRESPRDDDKDERAAQARDIRRRISEATGGNIDFDAPQSADPSPSSQKRNENYGTRSRGRGEAPDRGQRKPQAQGPRDPYAMSSDERMNFYKEKYGSQDKPQRRNDLRGTERPNDEGKGKKHRRGGKRLSPETPRQGEERRGKVNDRKQPQGKKPDGRPVQKEGGERLAAKPKDRASVTLKGSPDQARLTAKKTQKGIFSKILDIFSKRKK